MEREFAITFVADVDFEMMELKGMGKGRDGTRDRRECSFLALVFCYFVYSSTNMLITITVFEKLTSVFSQSNGRRS